MKLYPTDFIQEGDVNLSLLIQEALAVGLPSIGVTATRPTLPRGAWIVFSVPDSADIPTIQATIDNLILLHNPADLTLEQAQDIAIEDLAADTDGLYAGLGPLWRSDPRGAVFVGFARRYAVLSGDDPATINTKAQAVQYVRGRPEYACSTAALTQTFIERSLASMADVVASGMDKVIRLID